MSIHAQACAHEGRRPYGLVGYSPRRGNGTAFPLQSTFANRPGWPALRSTD